MCAQESSFGELFGISWEWHKKCSHIWNWKCVYSSNCSVELIKLYNNTSKLHRKKSAKKTLSSIVHEKYIEKRNYWLDWNACNSVGEYFCRCDFYIFFNTVRPFCAIPHQPDSVERNWLHGQRHWDGILRWVLLIHIDISYIYFVSMYKKNGLHNLHACCSLSRRLTKPLIISGRHMMTAVCREEKECVELR